MATLVCFHAHPDDETTATAGTMAKAAAAGHRVVLVTATRGEQGEPVPGVLRDGEALWERRIVEVQRSAEILGAEAVHFLGYEDSGMMGEPTNDNPACFWQADVDEAAERLAAVLAEVEADILTTYDAHGNYGHPDHIQVHRVGARAAEMAGVSRVFQATMNRDEMKRMMEEAPPELTQDAPEAPEEVRRQLDEELFGSAADEITHRIEFAEFVDRKREAMMAHESQIAPDSFFLQMPMEVFRVAFGSEWFIETGRSRPDGEPFADDLFADVTVADGAPRS
jgi:LmbE family N-acetylglucosaminyl deacetylase